MSRLAAVELRAPRAGDVEAVVAALRPADAAECDALVGPGRAADAITASLGRSTLAWAAEADGEVLAVLGVTPLNMLAGVGAPWLMSTAGVERHRGALIRLAPSYIAQMLAVFPHLRNVVDARNLRSIAWLRRLGFTIAAPVPVGVAGLPFHPFAMDA